MAGLFTGHESLQDIIDLAVTEFLDRLRARPGFLDALAAAEHEQQRRAGVQPVEEGPTGEDAARAGAKHQNCLNTCRRGMRPRELSGTVCPRARRFRR